MRTRKAGSTAPGGGSAHVSNGMQSGPAVLLLQLAGVPRFWLSATMSESWIWRFQPLAWTAYALSAIVAFRKKTQKELCGKTLQRERKGVTFFRTCGVVCPQFWLSGRDL